MVHAEKYSKLGALNRTGPHQVISDVGSTSGGEDLGPSPHRILEAALASCTVITLRMYAQRHGLDPEFIDADVEITKEEKGETVIRREIKLPSSLSPEQKARFFQIAEKCPIHEVLLSHLQIESRLVEG